MEKVVRFLERPPRRWEVYALLIFGLIASRYPEIRANLEQLNHTWTYQAVLSGTDRGYGPLSECWETYDAQNGTLTIRGSEGTFTDPYTRDEITPGNYLAVAAHNLSTELNRPVSAQCAFTDKGRSTLPIGRGARLFSDNSKYELRQKDAVMAIKDAFGLPIGIEVFDYQEENK